MYLRCISRNSLPTFFEFDTTVHFCNPLDKFFGQNNQIIFTPVFGRGGVSSKFQVFGAPSSFWQKIPFPLYDRVELGFQAQFNSLAHLVLYLLRKWVSVGLPFAFLNILYKRFVWPENTEYKFAQTNVSCRRFETPTNPILVIGTV